MKNYIKINGVNSIIMKVNNLDINDIKTIVDELANRINDSVIFFANEKENGVNFICKSSSGKVNAGLLVKKISQSVSGRGGGSPTFGQGGVNTSCDVDKILKDVENDIINN